MSVLIAWLFFIGSVTFTVACSLNLWLVLRG